MFLNQVGLQKSGGSWSVPGAAQHERRVRSSQQCSLVKGELTGKMYFEPDLKLEMSEKCFFSVEDAEGNWSEVRSRRGVLLGDWPVRFVSDRSTIDLERRDRSYPRERDRHAGACGTWARGASGTKISWFSFFCLFGLVWGPFCFPSFVSFGSGSFCLLLSLILHYWSAW